MLKHCHSRSGLPLLGTASHSLASLTLSQHSAASSASASGSEVSFDSSFGSAGSAAQSPVPSCGGGEMSGRSSLTSASEPLSLSSVSSASSPAASAKVSLKIYASCLRPDIEYKTLSVSYQARSRELIWQLLGKYKMKHRDPKLFYLSMEVVISKAVTRTLVLDEEARPAELVQCNPWGEARLTLCMKKGGLVRVWDSVLMTESQYKSLLISEETTVEDVVRILFHCYGLGDPETRGPERSRFCLYEHCRSSNYERKLLGEDRPLAVQDSWLDPDQFRLVLRRCPAPRPAPAPAPGAGSHHQLGLPCVPVHGHAMTDMGARALQASLLERYSKFCQKYESYFYV